MAVGLAVLSACGDDDSDSAGSEASSSAADTGYEIASTVGINVTSPFGRVYARGVNDAAERYGVEITNMGLTEDYTEQKAVDYLNSAIASKPDGIITAVYSGKAWEDPIKRAVDQGIPVIDVNSADPRPSDERAPYLFYIGEDGVATGRTAAGVILDEGSPQRAVCVISFPGAFAQESRCKGFLDEMAANDVDAEKLAVSPSDPTKAAETFRGYLTNNPETDAVYTLGPLGGDPAWDGVHTALSEEGKLGEIKWVTNDLSTQTLDAVKSGDLLATLDQQIYLQGYLAVQSLVLFLQNGFQPTSDINTGGLVVDSTNAAEFSKQAEDRLR